MTPIEKLIACARIAVRDWSLVSRGGLECALEEYESSPKPIEFPVEIDVEFKDGDWFTVDSDGDVARHNHKPVQSLTLGGMWTSEGARFFAASRTPDDWTKARWQLVDGKWVQK